MKVYQLHVCNAWLPVNTTVTPSPDCALTLCTQPFPIGSMPRKAPSMSANRGYGGAASNTTSPTAAAPAGTKAAVADLSAQLSDVSLKADGLEMEKEL